MSISEKARSLGLRFSHAALGLAVIHQLIGSEFMARPWRLERATPGQITLMEWHEWSGVTATVLLSVLAISLLRRYGAGSRQRFLPWLDAAGRSALNLESRAMLGGLRRLTAPSAAATETLAAAVQGLGLFVLLFFCVTGTTMWLLEDNLALMHRIGSIHELGALPLKLYLFGHAGMALMHELRGEGLIRRMFSPTRG